MTIWASPEALAGRVRVLADSYPEGFTYRQHYDEMVGTEENEAPVTGYAVGGIIPAFDGIPTHLEDWCEGVLTLSNFLSEEIYIGGWKEGAALVLDAVVIVTDPRVALRLARTWNQEAVGRIEGGEYLYTVKV